MYQFTMAALGMLMISSITTHGAFFETGGAVSHAGYFVNPDDLKMSFEELVANQDDGYLISLSSSTQNSVAQAAIRTTDAEHVVKPEEDLSSIAAWYGLKNVDTIMWANGLDGVTIQPGMRLAIPAADGIRYQVRPGDTLDKIAQRFQVPAADIATFNGKDNGSTLREGEALFVANAVVTSQTLIADNTPVDTAASAQAQATTRVASPTIDVPELRGTAPTVSAAAIPTGAQINDPAAAQPEGSAAVVTAAPAPPNSTPATPPPSAPVVAAAPAPVVAATTNAGGWTIPTPNGCRRTQGYHRGHLAIDCANRAGGPILAAQPGTVEASTCGRNGYGCHVIINHNNGFKTLYAHFTQSPMVSVGDSVGQGQQIGWMGTTGWSTGVHLHFELVQNGVKINPVGVVY